MTASCFPSLVHSRSIMGSDGSRIQYLPEHSDAVETGCRGTASVFCFCPSGLW